MKRTISRFQVARRKVDAGIDYRAYLKAEADE